MKKITVFFTAILISVSLFAQFVATMEVKEDIPGLCNKNEVYALFPMFDGQDEAIPPISEDSILARLNAEVQYIVDNPNCKEEGMVHLVINCKGDLVLCEIDNKTSSEELDAQIVAVFSTLKKWTPGKLNGKKVDTSLLFSFTIKKGKISFD